MKLEKLEIRQMPKLSCLPDCTLQLSLLKQLILESRGEPDSAVTLLELPEQIGDLSSLEEFTCSGYGLTKLPKSFGKLKQLKK
jgi:hypothetical protein